MDICIVGSNKDVRLQAFRRFAAEKVKSLYITECSTSLLAGLSDRTHGIVIFDSENQNTAETLAAIRSGTKFLSIPIVAVAGRRADNHSMLVAAGANTVITNEDPDEIWEEMQMCKSTESVCSEYRARVLQPFIEATRMTLQEMAAVTCEVASVYQKPRHRMFGDISAVIGLTAGAEGAMVFSFEEKTAVELSRRILQGVDDSPSQEVVRDCIGEVANVVSGQARGLLADTPYHFQMSTPTVIAGAGHEIRNRPGVPCVVAVFKTAIGEFAMQLCLSSNEQPSGGPQ